MERDAGRRRLWGEEWRRLENGASNTRMETGKHSGVANARCAIQQQPRTKKSKTAHLSSPAGRGPWRGAPPPAPAPRSQRAQRAGCATRHPAAGPPPFGSLSLSPAPTASCHSGWAPAPPRLPAGPRCSPGGPSRPQSAGPSAAHAEGVWGRDAGKSAGGVQAAAQATQVVREGWLQGAAGTHLPVFITVVYCRPAGQQGSHTIDMSLLGGGVQHCMHSRGSQRQLWADEGLPNT